MSRLKEIAIVAGLVAISAVPRFASLGRFTSIDEPFWLRQSGNFYYALGQREFQNTLYEYHPAVTTMWIITAGMLIYFPEYRALGQGYLKPGKFDELLVGHGKSLVDLLVVSRAVQVLLIVFLLVLVYALLRVLFGRQTAIFTTAFVSLSPFLIGQSRLLNHEAMVGLFSLVSLLSILVYLYRGRQITFLFASAAAAGLAQLTKSSGVPIIPVVMLAIFVHAAGDSEKPMRARLVSAAKSAGFWVAVLAATYAVVWPGMWVAPLAMLQDVYGNAFSYALQGVRTSVASGPQAQGFDLRSAFGGIGIYLNDLAWRTTPLTGLGLLAGVLLAFRRGKQRREPPLAELVLYALLLASAFVLLFGIQRSPKPPHYVLTSYVALDVVAGLGLLHGWNALRERFANLRTAPTSIVAIAAALGLQLASALSAYPYYISYYNPLVEGLQVGVQNPTLNETGYGMGLDQAARYLAAKPGAGALTVLSAHGLGSFSYYFPGRTVTMNDFSMTDPQVASVVPEADYIVVDYYNHKRKNIDQDLDSIQPETSIWLNGFEFLRIYPADVFQP